MGKTTSKEKENLICELYLQGYKLKEIIEKMGVSSKTICKIIDKNNIEKRNDHYAIEYNGKNQSITKWSLELGIPFTTIRSRISRGWTVEEILFGRKRISPKKKFKSSCIINAVANNNISGKVN